jgi:plastocyanin
MRKSWVLFVACCAISIGMLSGCTQQGPSGANQVNIQNYAFNPSTLTIKAGENVTWTNHDTYVNHQVKSDTGLFESGSLGNGQSFTYQFMSPGTYNYSCTIHPSMHGKIIVQ